MPEAESDWTRSSPRPVDPRVTTVHWRGNTVKSIVIVGGGYAGFYAARGLERRLRRGEAEVTVIDAAPYMTYQPFLPEVAAGSIEARHAIVPLRRHLRRARLLAGRVHRIDHGERAVHVVLPDGSRTVIAYDEVIVTAGAVSRVFPVPGVAEQAIGFKRIEEAVAIRDAVLTSIEEASALPAGAERRRRLTVTFVGGGFAGVEGFAEVLSMARALISKYDALASTELNFHLVDAAERILPEVRPSASTWVKRYLERQGAVVHLRTTVQEASGSHLRLSTGEVIDTGLLVWTAGIAANPVIARHTDLPINDRGLVVVRPDLRVGTATDPVASAWAAGDDAAVPDLANPGAYTTPNAQHAVRQGKRLARNVVAVLRGRDPRPYRHRNLGTIATLGIGQGIFESGPITLKGLPAWVVHRGYHLFTVPTAERKLRVLLGWLTGLVVGRDIASLARVQHPRDAFLEDAHRPGAG